MEGKNLFIPLAATFRPDGLESAGTSRRPGKTFSPGPGLALLLEDISGILVVSENLESQEDHSEFLKSSKEFEGLTMTFTEKVQWNKSLVQEEHMMEEGFDALTTFQEYMGYLNNNAFKHTYQ